MKSVKVAYSNSGYSLVVFLERSVVVERYAYTTRDFPGATYLPMNGRYVVLSRDWVVGDYDDWQIIDEVKEAESLLGLPPTKGWYSEWEPE